MGLDRVKFQKDFPWRVRFDFRVYVKRNFYFKLMFNVDWKKIAIFRIGLRFDLIFCPVSGGFRVYLKWNFQVRDTLQVLVKYFALIKLRFDGTSLCHFRIDLKWNFQPQVMIYVDESFFVVLGSDYGTIEFFIRFW